ncbi:imidazole glycerol phosphate synthase subunit HisH [Barnesiella propionica]|uniref:imidazole glycerol phosphate synthase subunit HisH n=1 Tax=Barnesiella propionica TaxID=2981781 RepID=UPI0011C968A1|nr:imidazole glycerol phosphate synthase subunit HisH [Barnesiella propionica]MCU6768178.1 imidazole glycerol phosphate synthase subunit HisH [Barnesiella propionica]
MRVVLIKYNAGNIYSVECSLKRAGIEPVVTDDKEIIKSADKVIFPGVGEAASTMRYLKEHRLDELIRDLKQPVLGICIGMQLMCKHSEEGNVDCLGIFDVPVRKFISDNPEQKIPHMGWNTISDINEQMFPQCINNQFVYYVHSYYVPVCKYTAGVTEYIHPFSAALKKDNFYAAQFHIEKSGRTGEDIMKYFLSL